MSVQTNAHMLDFLKDKPAGVESGAAAGVESEAAAGSSTEKPKKPTYTVDSANCAIAGLAELLKSGALTQQEYDDTTQSIKSRIE